MSLKTYALTRLILTFPMVILLVTIVFIIVRVLPGDPVLLHFGKTIAPGAADAVRHALGLDVPIWTQYFNYILGLFHGDLGKAFSNYQSVSEQIFSAFPATLELTISSTIIAFILGIALGVISSRHYGSMEDTAIRTFGVITYAVPIFFLGLILQSIFATGLHLLPATGRISAGNIPSGGYIFGMHVQTGIYTLDSLLAGRPDQFFDALKHLILPSLTLGIYLSGIFIRISRSNLLDTLRQEYVTAARARGLRERTILFSYGLRNAFLPILTVMGLQFAALLGGAVLTETTFAWGGLGTYIFNAIQGYDYTAIQGTVVFFGIMVAMVSFAVDVLYAYLDPRIKY